jgi:hypothetical protein
MAAAIRSAIGSGFRSPSPLAPSCFSDFPAAGVWRRAAFRISTLRTQMADDVRKIALWLIYVCECKSVVLSTNLIAVGSAHK